MKTVNDDNLRKLHTDLLVKKIAYLAAEREYIYATRPDDDLRHKVLNDIANLITITGGQIAEDK